MADASWDNGGHGVPAKAGLPLWAKIGIGCGVAVLLLTATCFGAGAFLVHRFKQDPKTFEKQAMAFAVDSMNLRPDWEDFRVVVEQLRTPEGTKALYAAHPALQKQWPTEAQFLAAAGTWRPDLAPVPDLSPELMREQGLHINKALGGRVEVGWSPKGHRAVYVTFEGPRQAADKGPRRVAELDVR